MLIEQCYFYSPLDRGGEISEVMNLGGLSDFRGRISLILASCILTFKNYVENFKFFWRNFPPKTAKK